MYTKVAEYAVIALAVLVQAPAAMADEKSQTIREVQIARLFNPAPGALEAEKRGRVHIYSDLYDTDVRRAMDQAFERIESMMFVRTIVTDDDEAPALDEATGEVLVEDDGC